MSTIKTTRNKEQVKHFKNIEHVIHYYTKALRKH